MTLYFVTGNSGKFEQAKTVLPEIERIDFDAPEIQEIDPKVIIEEKLRVISKNNSGQFFCEDVSIEIYGLNGLPGPLIKWFIKTVGIKGIYEMAKSSGNTNAKARIMVGYSNEGETVFFEEELEGEIVKPKGTNGFGWDPIFLPKGSKKTLGEMTIQEKNKIGLRKKALIKLKNYMEDKKK
jgi:non-canonical purine NTP pyrophosphatase (RdgB/HAM1 family)